MTKYVNLHSLVFNQPHLCTPEYAETVLAVLQEKLDFEGAYSVNNEAKEQEDSNLKDGLKTIPIIGSMVHRGSWMDAMSGVQSYSAIQANIQEALDNSAVDSILLEIDSPGGSVAGAFDLRDFIMEAKDQKPIYAIAKDTMASAAYLIGSACTKVYATQTAAVGSIGVVAMHMDYSEANKKAGVKPTFIYAGDYKTAGNLHQKLEGEALSYLQESVNDSYDMFVKAVAEARGLDEDVIRDTEARVYKGEKAKELGLVDEVISLDALTKQLATKQNGPTRVFPSMSKGMKMDKDEIEKLEADFAQASTDLKAVTEQNEALKKALIDNGFKITAEGVEKLQEEAKEFLELDGKKIDLSAMPTEAADALKALASEKADAELTKLAESTFPNMEVSVAKELVSANLSEDTLKVLKAADASFGGLMEEKGQTSVEADMTDPQDKMDALVTKYMDDNKVSLHKARVEVAKTSEGRELQKAIMKGL